MKKDIDYKVETKKDKDGNVISSKVIMLDKKTTTTKEEKE